LHFTLFLEKSRHVLARGFSFIFRLLSRKSDGVSFYLPVGAELQPTDLFSRLEKLTDFFIFLRKTV